MTQTTFKATAKQMKEMNTFKAVKFNKAQEVTAEATFTIINDTDALATFTDGTTKEMKIDSVRRSWEVVVEEEVKEVAAPVEAPAEEVQHTADEVIRYVVDYVAVAASILEETKEGFIVEIEQDFGKGKIEVFKTGRLDEYRTIEEVKAPEVAEVKVGSFVKLADGTTGKVTDIVGSLATVDTAEGEVPVKVAALEITEAPKQVEKKVDAPKVEKKKADKPEKAPKVEAEKIYGGGGMSTTIEDWTFLEGYSQQLTKEIKTVTLLGYEIVATEEDLEKGEITSGRYVEIIEYTGVVTSVKVFDKDETTLLWKSPKYSIKDLLENYLKLEGEELAKARRAVTTLKKQSKTIEKLKAGVVVG